MCLQFFLKITIYISSVPTKANHCELEHCSRHCRQVARENMCKPMAYPGLCKDQCTEMECIRSSGITHEF